MGRSIHPDECYCPKHLGNLQGVTSRPDVTQPQAGQKRKSRGGTKDNLKQQKLTDFGVKPAEFSKKDYPSTSYRQTTMDEFRGMLFYR